MVPGETIATGAPTTCPDCQVSVLPLVVLQSAAGYYIGTLCNCGPSYSRESDYYPDEAAAEAALADRLFGRDGIIARDVAVYWADQPAEHNVSGQPAVRFRVTVLHNTGSNCFRRYEPGDPLVEVVNLWVEVTGAEAAAELVFKIANSARGELYCDAGYAEEAATYRAAAKRSMSVGDVLLIRDDARTQTAWACTWIGFEQLIHLPGFTSRR